MFLNSVDNSPYIYEMNVPVFMSDITGRDRQTEREKHTVNCYVMLFLLLCVDKSSVISLVVHKLIIVYVLSLKGRI